MTLYVQHNVQYWHNGQCVINKSPVVCGHLAFLLQSFFNATHKHISKYRTKCGSHSDTVCLFKQLTIKNEKLILSWSKKIDKVLSTEMKLVRFINQFFIKALSVSSHMVSSKGTLVRHIVGN